MGRACDLKDLGYDVIVGARRFTQATVFERGHMTKLTGIPQVHLCNTGMQKSFSEHTNCQALHFWRQNLGLNLY